MNSSENEVLDIVNPGRIIDALNKVSQGEILQGDECMNEFIKGRIEIEKAGYCSGPERDVSVRLVCRGAGHA